MGRSESPDEASAARARPEPLVIRPANRDDGASVAALLAELDSLHTSLRPDFFRTHPASGATGSIRRVSAELLNRFQPDSSSALLLAVRGRTALGVVHVELRDTPQTPGFAQRRRLLIDSLVVTSRTRRLGVGRKLMEAAERWGKSRGAVQVVLTVWEGNDEATRFYEALG